MVDNGNRIQCSFFCPDFLVSIDTHTFPISFYLLPIEGADVVLGMDWLHSLGSLMADFSKPQISFTHNGLPITLHDTPKLLRRQSSFTHLCHLLHTNEISSLHLITIGPLPSPPSPYKLSNDPDISTLLKAYNSVFSSPHGLPPKRPHNRHIPLLPQSAQVNITATHTLTS